MGHNIGKREPHSSAFITTIADSLTQDSKDTRDFQSADRITTINGMASEGERCASDGSNIPKPRQGKDSPRAQIWSFQTGKNPKTYHRLAVAAANANPNQPLALPPVQKINQWVGNLPNQDYQPFDEVTPLSPSPAGQPIRAQPARPLPNVTKENIKRLISQQVGEKRKAEKEMEMILQKVWREREEAKRNQGLERTAGRLERELEKYEKKYKELEKRTKKEIEQKDAEIAELTEELEGRDDQEEEEEEEEEKAPAAKRKKRAAGAAAPKKPAAAAVSARATKKPTAAAATAKKPSASQQAPTPAPAKKPAAVAPAVTSARVTKKPAPAKKQAAAAAAAASKKPAAEKRKKAEEKKKVVEKKTAEKKKKVAEPAKGTRASARLAGGKK